MKVVWFNRRSAIVHQGHPDDAARTVCGADTRDLVRTTDGGSLGRPAVSTAVCKRCAHTAVDTQ